MSFSSFELIDNQSPILVFGKDGQVGKALQEFLNDFKMPIVFLGRTECDLTNEHDIKVILNRYQPRIIINAAAYTQVDKAQSESELAHAINAKAPAIMADYIARISKGVMVHFSTDYVFDGQKQSPYVETDLPNPLSEYGKSKLLGEQEIIRSFSQIKEFTQKNESDRHPRFYILRTSWVYGEGGNFIRTMLKLAAHRDHLKVIADQYGAPTSAQWLAQIAIELIGSNVDSGIYHAVPDGKASWHSLALFAIETAKLAGEGIELASESIQAIPAAEYPLPAPRPYNSMMNNQKLKSALAQMAFTSEYPHWQEQVESYVRQYVMESLSS